MSDATGPIGTLPGARHTVPDGARCDKHAERPATHRVQGETDSFGCEMHDLCDDCYTKLRAELGEDQPGRCDWCKKDAADLRPTRDLDEGLTGPVYYVCEPCARKRREELEAEVDDFDDVAWDDYEEDGPMDLEDQLETQLTKWSRPA